MHILINSYPDIIPLSAILPHNIAAKNRTITTKIQINLYDEVFSSHRSDYVAHCILGCDTFWLSKYLLVSQRNTQPPFSEQKRKFYLKLVAECSSRTSVPTNQAIWYNISKESNIQHTRSTTHNPDLTVHGYIISDYRSKNKFT